MLIPLTHSQQRQRAEHEVRESFSETVPAQISSKKTMKAELQNATDKDIPCETQPLSTISLPLQPTGT